MNPVKEQNTNILLAEDDDDDYYVFSLAVEEIPYTVILSRAENGEILMKLLDEKVPDILFLDLLMPCQDGRQCLRAIRSNQKFDHLPVIIYSSLSDLVNVEYCYREGSNLFVIKPTTIAELKDLLEKILSIDWKKTLYYPTKTKFVLNER
jgi:CheY-like chemotaxis protein